MWWYLVSQCLVSNRTQRDHAFLVIWNSRRRHCSNKKYTFWRNHEGPLDGDDLQFLVYQLLLAEAAKTHANTCLVFRILSKSQTHVNATAALMPYRYHYATIRHCGSILYFSNDNWRKSSDDILFTWHSSTIGQCGQVGPKRFLLLVHWPETHCLQTRRSTLTLSDMALETQLFNMYQNTSCIREASAQCTIPVVLGQLWQRDGASSLILTG